MTSQVAALPPQVEHALAAPSRMVPRAEHLEPFLDAARQVLEQELGTVVRRGKLSLAESSQTSQEITVFVAITGRLTGLAIYGMSNQTALAAVSRMLGYECTELDELALSGISELGNVITGRAATLLTGVDIAPPLLLQGAGSRVSTAGIQRLVVPLETELGTVEAQLAIKG